MTNFLWWVRDWNGSDIRQQPSENLPIHPDPSNCHHQDLIFLSLARSPQILFPQCRTAQNTWKKGELSRFIIPMMLPMSLVQNLSWRLETVATHQQKTDILTMTRGQHHSYDEWISGQQCWARTDVGTYLQVGICHFCDMANVLNSVFISISSHTSSKKIGGCWWEVRQSYDEHRMLYERGHGYVPFIMSGLYMYKYLEYVQVQNIGLC